MTSSILCLSLYGLCAQHLCSLKQILLCFNLLEKKKTKKKKRPCYLASYDMNPPFHEAAYKQLMISIS